MSDIELSNGQRGRKAPRDPWTKVYVLLAAGIVSALNIWEAYRQGLYLQSEGVVMALDYLFGLAVNFAFVYVFVGLWRLFKDWRYRRTR